MEREVWKDIEGYRGRYKISMSGRVMSLLRGKLLSQNITTYGYKTVPLRKYGEKSKNCFVHKLVLKAFKNKQKGKNCGNHLDGNKLNNCISNLEWCNHSENTVHAYTTGLIRRPVGENNSQAKLSPSDILNIRDLGKNRKNYKVIATKYNISISNVSAIVLRKSWKHIKEGDNHVK